MWQRVAASQNLSFGEIKSGGQAAGAADRLTTPEQPGLSVISSSALLDARVWVELSPWRLSAGWSLLAAALAAGIGDVAAALSPQVLVLLFLLVDPLWGSIWGSLTTPGALPHLRQTVQRQRLWLPYLTPGSPAARLFGTDGPGLLAILFRAGLPGTVLALLVAFSLGTAAVWATVAVLVLAIGGWLHREVELVPVPVLHSLAAVALPWVLGLIVFGRDPWQPVFWLPALLWTVHAWGGSRHLEQPGERLGLAGMALAELGLALFLIVSRVPLWLAVLALLWAPVWLAVYRGRQLEFAHFWWLGALLVTGLAVGQIPG